MGEKRESAEWNGLETGLGVLVELELTTRLALTGRAGWSFARNGSSWDASGTAFTAGISIY